MRFSLKLITIALLSIKFTQCDSEPSVVIAILIRNKAHILPYFFSYLENLEYPKDKITLWIRSDHNEDNTIDIIESWFDNTWDLYQTIDFKFVQNKTRRESESSPFDWTDDRFNDVIRMKEEAIQFSKDTKADFLFFLDADVLLTASDALNYLVSLNLPIVGPMLKSEGLYSNYWGGMNEWFGYKRTEEYLKILNREKVGEFSVPMIHSAVLINMNKVDIGNLTFNQTKLKDISKERYNGPNDDIITFAVSANFSNTSMYVSNAKDFGFVPHPSGIDQTIEIDKEKVTNLLLSIIHEQDSLIETVESVKKFNEESKKDRLGLSAIFVINLLRRVERKKRLQHIFDVLNIDAEFIPAVDKKSLSRKWIMKQGIKFMPGYTRSEFEADYDIPMTYGEIGVFMSHFNIWKRMVDENIQTSLILEDDASFVDSFRHKLTQNLEEVNRIGEPFDILYLGRWIKTQDQEIKGTDKLVKPGYSLFAHAYILTLQGARKLIDSNPLEKMIVVDEYLPLMYDKHPNQEFKRHVEPRNLIALAVSTKMVYQRYRWGDEKHVSETTYRMQEEINEWSHSDEL